MRSLLPALALSLTLSACGSTSTESTTTQPQPATTAAQAPDRVTVEALEGLELTSHQNREIGRMRAELDVAFGPAQTAREAFTAELLEQLRAGSLDTAALEARRRILVVALEQGKSELLESANELHDLLTPAQRRDLVDAMEQRTRPNDRGAMAKELDLSWDQKRRLMSAARSRGGKDRSQREQLRGQLEQAKQAFVGEAFDAGELALARDPVADRYTLAMTEAVALFMPILEPGQRDTLARRLERQL